MPKNVDIGVFCIGRTQVDREEVQRWLDYIGVETFEPPDDGSISNPALLIALAGKRCYKSFEVNKALNPNITKIREDYGEYFDNILASGHGSVLEHAVYNFAFENVSRVFTGEMNRHRAGWAISEGSMRFIRYSESIPFWMPTSIQGEDVYGAEYAAGAVTELLGDAATDRVKLAEFGKGLDIVAKKELSRAVFTRSFANTELCYRVLEAIWANELAPTSKFAGKKEITSMMRRIVGMGVATGGVWSGNIRALRHVITMRTDTAAEEEILHVFSRVAKMIKDKEPLMFGDFVQDDNGFWRPKYRKV